jgi:uncharacterized protein
VSAILKQSRSRIFVIGFVVVTLSVLVWSLTKNWSRRAETEAAAAVAQAGQKLASQRVASQKTNKDQPVQALKFEQLPIITTNGTVNLQVEVMRTPESQAQGLMFRQSMADDQGMLFDFSPERYINMWMKNTYISLDIVFVTLDGKIHRIQENTEPHSERLIESGVSIRGVLEIKAGTARRLGIKAGDRLVHSIFSIQ